MSVGVADQHSSSSSSVQSSASVKSPVLIISPTYLSGLTEPCLSSALAHAASERMERAAGYVSIYLLVTDVSISCCCCCCCTVSLFAGRSVCLLSFSVGWLCAELCCLSQQSTNRQTPASPPAHTGCRCPARQPA